MAFCAGPYLRHTKWVAKYVLGLRKEMSIRAVAQFTGLHWDSVKQIEKTYLLKKHKKPALTQVQYLGIDEVYLGKTLGYITVVRDLLSGAVLFIGKGKGGDALQAFRKRIGRKAKQIKAVTIDMSNAYSAWVAEVLPHSEIIYDHFHVIKLMNERMDNLRRSTMSICADVWPTGDGGYGVCISRVGDFRGTRCFFELHSRAVHADCGGVGHFGVRRRLVDRSAYDSDQIFTVRDGGVFVAGVWRAGGWRLSADQLVAGSRVWYLRWLFRRSVVGRLATVLRARALGRDIRFVYDRDRARQCGRAVLVECRRTVSGLLSCGVYLCRDAGRVACDRIITRG